MRVHIGTSGWSYAHWQSTLYPHNLPAWERLDHYLAHGYDTVELNSSFYQWPTNAAFRSWQRRLPGGFLFALKAPRLLTHIRQLYQPEAWLQRIERGLTGLGTRCGPFLVQLSPNLAYDHARLAYFLTQVPPGRKIAFEFRHSSWHREEVFALLEHHGAAYCVMSGANLPCLLRATTDFVYVRMHGPDRHHLYAGSYSDQDLRWWATRIREWGSQGREVFVYFNNDGHGHAVRNADTLKRLLTRP